MAHLGSILHLCFCVLLQSVGVVALVWDMEGPSKAPWAGTRQPLSKESGGALCSLLQEGKGQGDNEKWF